MGCPQCRVRVAASQRPNRNRPNLSPLRTTVDGVITGELKSKGDRVWDAFWSGGISNPLEVIEQITYLLFLRRLDDLQTIAEKKAISNLSLTQIKKTQVPEVRAERKYEFAARIGQVDAHRAAVERALATEDELFASLQSRAFSEGL